MNATTSPVARIAGVAIVLVLAAAIGLLAGNALNALNARDAGPAGGPGPFANVWGNVADDGVVTEAPGYADPYRHLIQQAAADAADDTFTQTWGNLDERRDAPAADATSAGATLTAPTPR